MNSSISTKSGAALVALLSLLISTGLVLIGGMLFAAAAFGSGATIVIPWVATFHGFAEGGDSPAMTFSGSWGGAGVLVVALATLITLVINGTVVGRSGPTRTDAQLR
jgi:hypothetical protein